MSAQASPDSGDTESESGGGMTDPDTASEIPIYTWSSPAEPPTDADLSGVFGFSSTDVFAVGTDAAILHFDGETWSPMEYPGDAPISDLGAVWGSSPGDVFAVGTSGVILHYDGETWEAMASPTATALRDVCGRAPDDVYAVGDDGTLLAFDGATWSAIPTSVEQDLLAVFCAPGTAVYASGHLNDAYNSSAVVLYDGEAVSAVDHPIGHFMYALGGFAPDTVFLGGDYQDSGEALHFELYRSDEGGAFTYLAEGEALLIDLFAVGDGELWAVGRGIDGAVGEQGAVYHFVGGFAVESPVIAVGASIFRSVFRPPEEPMGKVFAVGDDGAILMGTPEP